MHSPAGPSAPRGVILLVGTLAAIYLVSQFLRNSVGVIAPDLADQVDRRQCPDEQDDATRRRWPGWAVHANQFRSFAHDLVRKPRHTFRDHAPAPVTGRDVP